MTPWAIHEILQVRILESFPEGDLPNPGIEPRSPALQGDSEPPGKPEIMVPNSLKVYIEIFVDKMICLGII